MNLVSGTTARLAVAGFVSGAMLLGVQIMTRVEAHYGCVAATISGTSGVDDLVGDGQSDPSHDHADFISAHAGNDRVAGHDCGDELHGGEGRDRVLGSNGGDRIFGEDNGDSNNNYCQPWCADLDGGPHDDLIEGNIGDDQLLDYLHGSDTDTLRGGEDGDDLYANDNDPYDTINGGNGADDWCWEDANDSLSQCEY